MAAPDINEVVAWVREGLANGVGPWRCPWRDPYGARNGLTGHRYRGLNPWLLSARASAHGWTDPRWCTARQMQRRGWRLMPGQTAVGPSWIAAMTTYFPPHQQSRPKSKRDYRLVTRWYAVYNFDQLINAPSLRRPRAPLRGPLPDWSRADDVVARLDADIRHGRSQASYSPHADVISMPDKEHFISPSDYYATLFHELAHWTSHSSRLNRPSSGPWGSPAYALEELVAELAAANCMASLGLDARQEVREDHLRYISGWIRALHDKPGALLTAARRADKVTRFILRERRKASESAGV